MQQQIKRWELHRDQRLLCLRCRLLSSVVVVEGFNVSVARSLILPGGLTKNRHSLFLHVTPYAIMLNPPLLPAQEHNK